MSAEPSARSLTAAYVAALGAVAALSFVSHFMLDHALKAHAGAASVINASGRQRMLSQRISGLAAQYALGDPTARPALRATIDEFEAAHERLVHGAPGGAGSASATPRLQALYFSGPAPLDAMTRRYIACARRVLVEKSDDPHRTVDLAELFATSRRPLLLALDAVTVEHERVSDLQLERLKLMQLVSFLLVLATLAAEAVGVFRPMVRRIVRHTAELHRAATTDPLTGALNRRSFTQRACDELSRSARHGRRVSLLMVDADRFKDINDTHGHGVGDEVLVALSAALEHTLRPSDLVGRLGGEEFAVLLPETALAEAEFTAERLRAAVARLRVPGAGGEVAFTISLGATQFAPGERSLKPAMDRADTALYAAKTGGRDRVATVPAPAAIASVRTSLAEETSTPVPAL